MAHLLPSVEPKSSPEMVGIIRSILDAAIDKEVIFMAIEYKFADGKMNAYSVSQAVK